MNRKRILVCTLGLTLLAAGPGTAAAAYDNTDGGPRETTNYNQYSNNPIGVGFGSDAELGASGSTPGFIMNRESQDSTIRVLAADSAKRSPVNGWGWLGLLGLLGLLRFRRTDNKR